jgi:cobalamin biosynthesis Mg chelatase CobN
MKNPNFKIIAIFVGFLFQTGTYAHAVVVVNPVDLTPTAMQASGAKYGSNVVTHLPKDAKTNSDVNETTTTTSTTDGNLVNRTRTEITTTRSSADATNEESAALANNAALTQSIDQQAQQQQMEPGHSAFFWTILALALVVVGLGVYAAKKRYPQPNIRA